MLGRLRLPGKLFVAGLPLVVTLVAAAGFLVVDTLGESDDVAHGAALARTWQPLTGLVGAVSLEEEAALAGGDVTAVGQATDDAADDMKDAIAAAGNPVPLIRQFQVASATLRTVRADAARSEPAEVADGYASVRERFLEIGALMPSEVANEEVARDLAAVSAMARAGEAATVEAAAAIQAAGTGEASAYDLVRVSRAELDGWLATFEASASGELLDAYRTSRVPSAMSAADRGLRLVLGSDSATVTVADLTDLLSARDDAFAEAHAVLVERIATSATAAAQAAEREAWTVIAAAGAALLVGTLATAGLGRSVVRRVRSVTTRAAQVTDVQLPRLVESIRDPRGEGALPSLPPIGDTGRDEVGELARSFGVLQAALEEVAAEQVKVLRKGVSDLFVTLARRNRSLVDRQLGLIDELERDEEDPELLADLYRIDHLATRMRRNAESLLVMAGVEPPRGRRAAVEIDDVARAAIGEIEDFRRVDVLTLESVRIAGGAVADVSHLLAELLENATAFSPPDSRVRVTGHFHQDGYLVTIADRGMGMAADKLVEANSILSSPPVVGLALDPTLGLYVVSVLARRHGIDVSLVPGAPGVSANILIPPGVFEASLPEPTPRHLASVGATRPPGEPAPLAARAAVPSASAPGVERTPSAEAKLPTRRPGESFAPEPDRLSTAPPLSRGESLPVRSPGTSYEEKAPEGSSTGTSGRGPEELRSAFSSYRSGTEAAKRETDDERSEEHP